MKLYHFFFTVAVLLGAILVSSAEAGYTFTVTEDYTNENGEPGLDPLFNHSFPEGAPATPEESIGRWYINGDINNWKHVIYIMSMTTDTITFNLEPDWTITEATVELLTINNKQAVFTGATGSRTLTEILPNGGSYFWTVTSQEIGAIQSIELSTSQGHFGHITLTISAVPEPSVLWLLMGGAPLLMLFRRRK